LLFVTGKGGVGKTTVAASMGVLAAGVGKRTLLVEADAKGDIATALSTGRTVFEPREVQPNLHVMSMNTEDSMREYLKQNLKVPIVGRLGPVARSFDFLATAAPGVREIMTIGKLASEVRDANWDLVVVDAVASGHIIGQLASPQALANLVGSGLISDQTKWMLDILSDPAQTGAVLVALAEEMPVVETIELAGRVRDEANIDVAAVVVNRVLPELFSTREEEAFVRISSPATLDTIAERTGHQLAPMVEAAALAVRLRRTRAGHIANLREGLPDGIDQLYLPEVFTQEFGEAAIHSIADALGAELGFDL